MRRCKHEDVMNFFWQGSQLLSGCQCQHCSDIAKMRKCRDCGETLSLGSSNDYTAAVELEIDAAHVASQWNERQAEWLAIEALSDPGGRNVAVIGLARCIIDHDTEQRKG